MTTRWLSTMRTIPPAERQNGALAIFALAAAATMAGSHINERQYQTKVAALDRIYPHVVHLETTTTTTETADMTAAMEETSQFDDRSTTLTKDGARQQAQHVGGSDDGGRVQLQLNDQHQDYQLVLVSGFLQSDDAGTLDDPHLQLRRQGWVSGPLLHIRRSLEMYQGRTSKSKSWSTDHVDHNIDPPPALLGVHNTTASRLYFAATSAWGDETRLLVSKRVFSDGGDILLSRTGAEKLDLSGEEQQPESQQQQTQQLLVPGHDAPFLPHSGIANCFIPQHQFAGSTRSGDVRLHLECYPPQDVTILALHVSGQLIPGYLQWLKNDSNNNGTRTTTPQPIKISQMLAGRLTPAEFFAQWKREETTQRNLIHLGMALGCGFSWYAFGNSTRLLSYTIQSPAIRYGCGVASLVLCPLFAWVTTTTELHARDYQMRFDKKDLEL